MSFVSGLSNFVQCVDCEDFVGTVGIAMLPSSGLQVDYCMKVLTSRKFMIWVLPTYLVRAI